MCVCVCVNVCASPLLPSALSYSKLVQKGMEKAELIIKVVMSPHERAEEFLSSYSKLMQGDTDIANFQKVLEMKVQYVHVDCDTCVAWCCFVSRVLSVFCR